ncbi:1755_t:CDS:2, partial [Diversispora eburnea]
MQTLPQERRPPPTYEEVSSMLSYRESPAGQRDRSASPPAEFLVEGVKLASNKSLPRNESDISMQVV